MDQPSTGTGSSTERAERQGGDVHVDQVTGPVAYHGEGPVWSERWGGLRWVDMLAGDVLSLRADGSVHRRHVGDVVAAVRPRVAGGAVIGIERGFALEEQNGTITRLADVWSDEPGAASLYRLDPDRSVHVVLDGVTVSNGLDWSPDGSLAYYNDTATHRIAVFDYDREAGFTGGRVLAHVEGRPDGLTVDAEGGVWTALSDRGVVERYTPEGRLDEVIPVPARKATACAFGGADLRELFITTSQERMDLEEDPLAGSLFVAVPGVSGVPVREFAG
jgi:sugar lactone lactonase YvrE